MNWQTPTALILVALTVILFLLRLAKKSRKSCGGGCCQSKNVDPLKSRDLPPR